MNKRTFIKLSSTIMLTPLLSPLKNLGQGKLKNWAGNLEYSTSNVFYPRSAQELQQLVKKYRNVKALGSRHCFNDIADSKYNLVSFKEMNKVVSLDANAPTIT